jgi:hypothetical protein
VFSRRRDRLDAWFFYILETCAKLLEVIKAMLDPEFESKVGAVNVRPITTGYEAMTGDVVFQEF